MKTVEELRDRHAGALTECQRILAASGEQHAQREDLRRQLAEAERESADARADAAIAGGDTPKKGGAAGKLADAIEEASKTIAAIARKHCEACEAELALRIKLRRAEAEEADNRAREHRQTIQRLRNEQDRINGELGEFERTSARLTTEIAAASRDTEGVGVFTGDMAAFDALLIDPTCPVDRGALAETLHGWRGWQGERIAESGLEQRKIMVKAVQGLIFYDKSTGALLGADPIKVERLDGSEGYLGPIKGVVNLHRHALEERRRHYVEYLAGLRGEPIAVREKGRSNYASIAGA